MQLLRGHSGFGVAEGMNVAQIHRHYDGANVIERVIGAPSRFAHPPFTVQEKSEMGCMDGVVGAVDGLFVRIEAPATSDDLSQVLYCSTAKKTG